MYIKETSEFGSHNGTRDPLIVPRGAPHYVFQFSRGL